jgi:hypothetical protein
VHPDQNQAEDSKFTTITEESVQNRAAYDQAELIRFALIGIDARITELNKKRDELLGQTGHQTASVSPTPSRAASSGAEPRKRKKISAAHRAKLKAAAKLRWEKVRAAKK